MTASTAADLQVALGDRSYRIRFTAALPGGLLTDTLRDVKAASASRALVVTDGNVGPHYAADALAAVRAAGLEPALLTLPPGEASKQLSTLSSILDAAFDHGLLRADLLVALGGGVIGDLTGFAASVLHRGVGVVQVPTTLLAQVDSAVGGKTGVNHATGKNLIGAFWQPRAVVSSQHVLRTLPAREVRCGLAEALKHGLIADATLVERACAQAAALVRLDAAPVAALVRACCAIKARVVAADERDHGQRALLNLGHTFGHAFEQLLGYGTLTHGEGVALGTVLAARLSERLGVAAAGLEARVTAHLDAFGLPTDPDSAGPDLTALIAAARRDKKADAHGVRFVLLVDVGQAEVRELSWETIRATLQ